MLHLDAEDRVFLTTWGIRFLAVFVAAIVIAITLGAAFRAFEIVSGF